MLNLHRLRILSELQQRGTLVEVARVLSYSPSTLSQQLSTLEQEVGVALLEPAGRRIELTRHGRLLAAHARRLIADAERAEAELRSSLTEPRGVVRLGCFQTAALVFIADLLTHVATQWPHLRLEVAEIAPDGAIEALLGHDYDMVLGEEYPGRPLPREAGATLTLLAHDGLYLVGDAESPPTQLTDLADADWVMEPGGNVARDWATAVCREAGFEPRVRYESADLLVQMRLAETGHAVALLPGMVWAARKGNVSRVSLSPPQSRGIFTAIRTTTAGDPALEATRQSLEETVGTHATEHGQTGSTTTP